MTTVSGFKAAYLHTLRVLHWVAGLMVVVLMTGVTADVLLRALRGSGIRGFIEWAEPLLVIIVFLVLGGAQRDGTHVRTDILVDRVSPRIGAVLKSLGALVLTVWCVLVSYVSVNRAVESIVSGEYRFGVARVPVWPARTVVALGFVILTLVAMTQLWKHSSRLLIGEHYRAGQHSRSEASEVHERGEAE